MTIKQLQKKLEKIPQYGIINKARRREIVSEINRLIAEQAKE